MPDAPRWVARGIDQVPRDVLVRYLESDERSALRELDDRLVTPLGWHPFGAGVLVAFLLAFPLAPLAIGAGTTAGTVAILGLCIVAAVVVAVGVRWQLVHSLLPTLRLLRPDAEVPFGFEPHLYYLASWARRAGTLPAEGER